MTYPILYSFRRCPYAMRARLGLRSSGINVELREVVLRDKPSEMIAISPKATVPVLQLQEGRVIDESLDVMIWALEQSDPQGWLSADQDEMMGLIKRNDTVFKHHLDRYKYPPRYVDENVSADDEQAKAEVIIADLEKRLEENAFLLGANPSLADYALLPFIRQFAHVDMNWFDQAPYPHVQKWLNDFKESALFQSVMTKYAQWHAGDNPVIF